MNCENCKKLFKTKKGYQYHVNNQVCLEKNKICNSCGKYFKDRRNYNYHIDHKVCENKSEKSEKYKIKLKKADQYIRNLENENFFLKGENRALKENPQNINIDKQQINIIVPPAFLKLDTLPKLMKILPNLLHDALSKHPTEFVSYLIKETNCNPERPIFNSIKIPNKKEPYAQISDGSKFIYAPKKQIISQLIENKKSLLQEYVDQNEDSYGKKILMAYQRYKDLLEDDNETIKDLEVEITCMLLNMSDVIGSDEWSQNLLKSLKESYRED